MKKLVLLLALAGTLGVSAAEESYIYWMVSKYATGTEIGGDSIVGETYTAKVSAFRDGTAWTADQTAGQSYLDLYSTDLATKYTDGVSVGIGDAASGLENFSYFANIASCGSGYTYFVELWNEGSVVARSEGLPYEQASIAALADIAMPGTRWAPMTFVAAPEPNSALLLLIGCATLALRRRKQAVA